MDFDDSPGEAIFRVEVRNWLRANFPTSEELAVMDYVAAAKFWQKRKYDAGYSCLDWPEEFGGRNTGPIEQVIWTQEEGALADLVDQVFGIGQGMVAPTLRAYATTEQTARYLPKIASGEEIWCQLFSEPGAGSDLAGIRTKAVQDGDDWVINGQKIWTSGAQHSDFAILLTRHDPALPKHQGLTYFFLSMKSPGVYVTPIKQISGNAHFNEVFLTDVRIPDQQRLGAVGEGWKVALTTLMNERVSVGTGSLAVGFDAALSLAQRVNINDRPAIKDAAVRAKLADWYVQEVGLKYTLYRTLSALSRGQTPGPENSICKLVGGAKTQDMASFCMDLLEQSGTIWDDVFSTDSGVYPETFMTVPGLRIAGGTDEIMANIIAERVLGLPQEPRVDKGIPFDEIPTSARV